MKQYELWRSEDGLRDSFFQAGDETAYQWLEPSSYLVWTVAAKSYNEAQRKRYDFMGWGTYRSTEEELSD